MKVISLYFCRSLQTQKILNSVTELNFALKFSLYHEKILNLANCIYFELQVQKCSEYKFAESMNT